MEERCLDSLLMHADSVCLGCIFGFRVCVHACACVCVCVCAQAGLGSSCCITQDYKKMYWDFNDLGKSNDLMKLEINVLYLYIVVSCVPCVNLMPLRPVLVFEFRPVVVNVAALDQHKRYKGPLLTGTIRLF